MPTCKKDGEFQSNSQTYQTSCWGPTSSSSTVNVTSMHSTSCQKLSQEENRQQPEGGNCKTTGPQKLPQHGNHLTCRNWMPHHDKCNRCSATQYMQRDSNVQLGNSNVRICHKFGHFTTVCYQKSQGQHSSNSFQSKKLKAQQLCAGALYTLHDADSSEYESETEDTFCLQMKIHRTRISHPEVPKPVYYNGQPSLPLTGTSHKKPVPTGQVRHLC